MSSDTPVAPERPTLISATATGTGQAFGRNGNNWSYHLAVAGSGAVSATATVEVSNNNAQWVSFGTLSASGTTSASDSIVGTAPWAYHRARIDTISGTSAVASVTGAGV